KSRNGALSSWATAERLGRAYKSSVVYCELANDPLSATANYTAYHTSSLRLTQHADMAEIAGNLVRNRIPVLISKQDTELTREWYQLAKLHVDKVRRSIS
ncbi:DNA adenine methylase, partial [Salmonella enterica]|uniref:DNA adenine methylase n=1 Tax=Salmonella enterica TaxID=28901 RepID=UPI0015C61360